MQIEAPVGRPPLPDDKKRNVRKVALFTTSEWEEIEAHLEREGIGINDLMRDTVLERVRDALKR